MRDETDKVLCDWCQNPIPSPREGQRFCRNNGQCRNAWHKHNARHNGIPGTVRGSGDLGERKGGGKYLTLYFSEEQARRVRAKPGETVYLLVE